MLLLGIGLLLLVDGRFLPVSPSNWTTCLRDVRPGDTVFFPGTVSNPVFYVSSSWTAFELVGNSTHPILVEGEEFGGAIIRMDGAAQNALDLTSANFLTMRKLVFEGGDNGMRLGTNSGVVSNSLFEDLLIRDCLTNAFRLDFYRADWNNTLTFENNIFRRMELTNFSGACMTLGAFKNPYGLVRNTTVEYCYCHDARNNPDGILLLGALDATVVRFNVFHNLGLGIRHADNYGYRPTEIYGNLIAGVSNNGIQVAAGAWIHDNILFDCANAGIAVNSNDAADNWTKSVRIEFNTVLRGVRALFLTLVGTENISISGNIFDGDLVVDGRGNNNQTCRDNLVIGILDTSDGSSLEGFLRLNGSISDYVNCPAAAGDISAPWPINAGVLNIIQKTSTVGTSWDFNCNQRTWPATVGAYSRTTAGPTSNPGWPLAYSQRPPCLQSVARSSSNTGLVFNYTASTPDTPILSSSPIPTSSSIPSSIPTPAPYTLSASVNPATPTQSTTLYVPPTEVNVTGILQILSQCSPSQPCQSVYVSTGNHILMADPSGDCLWTRYSRISLPVR